MGVQVSTKNIYLLDDRLNVIETYYIFVLARLLKGNMAK